MNSGKEQPSQVSIDPKEVKDVKLKFPTQEQLAKEKEILKNPPSQKDAFY